MIEDLFINILEISITSAAAIGIILLISGLAENKFRKKWRYWVWMLLAIYLIVPFKFDLPDAPIHIEIPPHEMVITEKPEHIQSDNVIGMPSEIPEGENFGEGSPEHGEQQIIQGTGDENFGMSTAEPQKQQEEQNLSTTPRIFIFPLVFLGSVIWACGAVLVCGWNVAMYIRFVTRSRPWNRKIENEEVIELFEYVKKDMGISGKIGIFENRLIKSPMMVGFLKPKVLLPSEALLPEEYEFVIRHELTHYKRGDIWYKFLLMLAASVHWFNPMVGTMCRYAENDIEITCDEAVVKAMEGDRRQEYCATILNIMRRGQNSPLLLSTSFYGGAKVLKKRFSAVLEPKAHRGVVLFIIAALVIIISGTLVACKTAEIPEKEEPALNEEQEEVVLTAEDKARNAAQDLIRGIYANKFNKFVEEDALAGMKFSKEAKKTVDEIQSGKTILFSGDEKISNKGVELKLDIKEAAVIEEKAEIVFGIDFAYIPRDAENEEISSNIMKVVYDTEKEEFTKILLYGYNWFANGSDKPEVTGPDENGVFPVIKAADWDRWVTYNGKADTVKPEEKIPSVLESERAMKYLSENYPGIDDWEIVYEKNDYVLEICYDPYTYSYRPNYLPKKFVLLKTEKSDDFDRLFFCENQSVIAITFDDNGEMVYEPRISYSYSDFTAFEKDINAGDLSGSVILGNGNYFNHLEGDHIWFPKENRMIFFGINERKAYAVEGISEPIYIYNSENIFGRSDITGKRTEAPSGRENDLFLYIELGPRGSREDMTIAYYDAETKTVDFYEKCVAEGIQVFPQVYFLDSETMVIEANGIFTFYKTAPHNLMTEAFAEFGGSGKGLCEETAESISFLGIDKIKGDRYFFIYTEKENEEYRICTFDRKGNILSNFGLGLSAEGYIGSANFKSGIVYFSYYSGEGESTESENYAVDARAESKHKLQADAW